jgi:putative flippase GtrA
MRKFLGKIHRSESPRATFARFATVGLSISIIDVVMLYILIGYGVNPYLGRIVSLASSMAAGYALNRYFTFHYLETGRALWHSLLRHYSVHAVGAGLNIAVFTLMLQIGLEMGGRIAASATLPLLGVWIGGMAGLCFNYILSRKLVFDY